MTQKTKISISAGVILAVVVGVLFFTNVGGLHGKLSLSRNITDPMAWYYGYIKASAGKGAGLLFLQSDRVVLFSGLEVLTLSHE